MGEVLHRIRLREVMERLGNAGWTITMTTPFKHRGEDQTAVLIEHLGEGREERDWGDLVLSLERLAKRVNAQPSGA